MSTQLRFSTRYEICQRVLSLMTEKANTLIYWSRVDPQYKFNVMNRLGRSRALVELCRLDRLPQ